MDEIGLIRALRARIEDAPFKAEQEGTMDGKTASLDPAVLTAFAASLANLPKGEIGKVKKLYILNAIAEFKAVRTSGRAALITFGVMSIFPFFLIVFIPALISFRSRIAAERQKILNAIDVWREDLGPGAEELIAQASA
jgi:hypothetical protein